MTKRRQPLQTPPTPLGRLRREADLSLRELADLSGVSRGTLSLWERGRFALKVEDQQKVLAALEAATLKVAQT